MAKQARSAESRAKAGRLALALGFMARDPTRAARILEGHSPDHSMELFAALKTAQAAAVLARMTPQQAALHLGVLSPEDSATIVKAFSALDAAAILRSMDARRRAAILRRLSSRKSVRLNWALNHPETSIGAWTNSETLTVANDITAQEALSQIRKAVTAPGEFVFVINRERHLLGMVSTTALLRAAPDTPISRLLESAPTALQAQASLGSAASLSAWQLRNALPVEDRQQRFVGVLHRADFNRGMALAGVESGDANFTDTLLEATEAYWSGMATLWRATFSLLSSASDRSVDAPGRKP